MRTLTELIITDDPGWTVVKDWIGKANNQVEILPCERHDANKALLQLQVTTRSLMGAVIYETGGLLIDGGWIRILGSGSKRLKRSLPAWNKGKTFQEYGEQPPYLLVADDVIGGFYAINGGYFGDDFGNIYYFSPDLLEWLPMKIGYPNFLLFCFETNMDEFYEGLRWKGWLNDITALSGDYAYRFDPFLWSEEGKEINNLNRQAIPVEQIYEFNMDMVSTSKE